MTKTAANPWDWSLQFGFNQAEVFTNPSAVISCAGQAAINADGQAEHPDDMAKQLALALDNLEAVLTKAGAGMADLAQLRIYTTDVDLFFQNIGILATRLGAAGVTPPQTLIGVSRLAFPELLVELEATAIK